MQKDVTCIPIRSYRFIKWLSYDDWKDDSERHFFADQLLAKSEAADFSFINAGSIRTRIKTTHEFAALIFRSSRRYVELLLALKTPMK